MTDGGGRVVDYLMQDDTTAESYGGVGSSGRLRQRSPFMSEAFVHHQNSRGQVTATHT